MSVRSEEGRLSGGDGRGSYTIYNQENAAGVLGARG